MNHPRRVKLAVVLAAGTGLLALAGGAAGAHMGPTGANAKHASTTLLVWDQEVRGGQNASMKALNAAFEKKFPDIKINRVA
jgi:raffinose/stachyose/melibiose transport system substrate-binding protein